MKYKLELNLEVGSTEITGDNFYMYINKQTKDGQVTLKLPIHNVSTVEGLRDGTTTEHYNVAGWIIKEIIE